MKLNVDFKFALTKEQHDQLKEMAAWVFDGYEIDSTYYESYTIIKKDKSVKTQYYVNYITLLLFHIPMNLGMDVVIVDPENPSLLMDQIYEKYRIYNNIPEVSKKKPKYKNSVCVDNKGFSEEDFYGFCGC